MTEIFVVHCPRLESQVVHFHRDHTDWPVVWVDLPRLISFWENSPRALLLPPASTWDRRKCDAYRDGLANTIIPYTVENVRRHGTGIGRLNMPRISFGWDARDQRLTVGFVNGRHRTRMLEALGAMAIPVQIAVHEEESLRAHCAARPDMIGEELIK
ncbi:plasmid fertility inhibition factor family protein [Sinorhizobium fredii]|uniref:plasmid fertility inhibition factor family protein n=1 Tax=Rhizobium fredii TaxID=380 RepID=UPI0035110D41